MVRRSPEPDWVEEIWKLKIRGQVHVRDAFEGNPIRKFKNTSVNLVWSWKKAK